MEQTLDSVAYPLVSVYVGKKVFGAILAVIIAEIVTALVEGGGKQRHWCRYSNCSMRSRLNGVGGLLFFLDVCSGVCAGSVDRVSQVWFLLM